MIDLSQELNQSFSYLQKSQDSFEILLTVPEMLSYFTGHFPGMPILPAVGIIDVSVYLLQLEWPELKTTRLKNIDHIKIKSGVTTLQQMRITFVRNSPTDFHVTWKDEQMKDSADLNFAFQPLSP